VTRPLLIVKTGTTLPDLVSRCGDFEDWIARGLGLPQGEIRVVSVFRGEPLPDPASFSGVVVSGSSAMVSDREDWSERAADWLPTAIEAGTPLLGICYGHQLLAHALGGRVGLNPRGREIGTVAVRFHGADGDPLLGVMPRVAQVHATHLESVLELPAGAKGMASSDLDPHHAFAVGEGTWGVQFHPEFDAEAMRGYLEGRRAALESEGLDPEALIRSAIETPDGDTLLRRFGRIAVERG
jgi:GMP synthase (glutamine-hydrolysing)